jgi:hypothetical protein
MGWDLFARWKQLTNLAGRSAARKKRARPAFRRLLQVEALEKRELLAGTITGTVFEDFNANGVLDTTATLANSGAGGAGTIPLAVDQGVGGVTVKAFDATNTLVTSATSAANGTYSLTVPTGTFRIEFSSFPAGFVPGPHGASNGTTTQFAADGATNVDFGLVRPPDYVQDNVPIAIQQYLLGASAGNNTPTIISFPYSAGESTPPTPTSAVPDNFSAPGNGVHTLQVPDSAVGATFGLAWDPTNRNLYAGAFYKSYSGYGPGGPGAVYRVAVNANGTYNATSVLVNLDALFPGASGGNRHAASPNNDDANSQWDAVGTTGLGGMAISPDGSTLYVIALGNRTLYALPLNLGRPLTAADVRKVAVPLASIPNATGATPGNDVRPFAVRYYNGTIYVGLVNSAENTNKATDLHAYVYAVTDNGTSLTFGAAPVLQFDLAAAAAGNPNNYPRGFANKNDGSANWPPWSPVINNVGGAGRTVDPQPILSDLAFDASGNLVLGFRDRAGDETYNTDGAAPHVNQARPAGDVLRAFGSPGTGWTLEKPALDPAGGAANGKGPGGGEFYYQSDFPQYHDHVPLGGILQLPGYPDVLTNAFDPVRLNNQVFQGGVRWMNDATGADQKDYRIYDNTLAGNFGKASGLGELVALTDPAPLEIGSRVWLDTNGNGIQDPGEPGIAGVTVDLFQGGVQVGTTTTDANGNYYFNAGDVAGGLLPNTAYEVRIPVGQAAVSGYALTAANVGGDPLANSRATLSGANAVIDVTTGGRGQSNHTLDAGFVPASVSGFVYVDTNGNGVRDAGDGALGGVAITLKDAGGNTVATTTTAADGSYRFAGLAAGTYSLLEAATLGYAEATNNVGTVNGTASGTAPAGKDELDSVQLTAGSAGINYDFGEAGASLAGFVYVDTNGNGVRDAGDGALGGVGITLKDAGGNTVATTTTAADGSYRFAGLAAGTYSVSEAATPGYAEASNNVGTVNGSSSGTAPAGKDELDSVQLTAGSAGINYDFGEAGASLSGFVYVDANGDGARDAGDGALGGVGITLKDPGGNTVATTTTAADGSYSFAGLAAGTYSVFEAATPGYAEATNNVGTVNGSGSGTAPAGKDELDAIQLTAGSTGVNYDFGEAGASLSGFVYVDTNGNGVRDAGDEALGGVAITLKNAGGNTVATTTSAADGSYRFPGLAAGAYSAFEAATPGYAEASNTVGTVNGTASGTAPAGKDELDSVQLTAGGAGINYDFGEAGASLAGFVYVDSNGNGVRDAGDGALGGVAITLKDAAGNTVATTTTAADGSYSFAGLAAGTYSVFEGATPGYAEAMNNVGTVNGSASGTAPAGKDELDSVQLTAGSAGANYDFGEAGASLSGFVYVDTNGNGARDAGDGALAGVGITLKDAGGNTVATTTTAADGSYNFAGLAAGTYSVFEGATPGYAEATNNVGTVNGTASGTAPAGKDELDSVQLTAGCAGISYDFGELGARLSGFVYVDTNGNGVRDAGDGALGGVAITLKDAGGNTVATATTAADGSYAFAGLAAGAYSVFEGATPGYAEASNNVGTVNGTASGTAPAGKDEIDSVQLTAGGTGVNYDFGETGHGLSGFVYVDANSDGVRDAGDGALGGVALTLKDAGGNTVATTTTAADGSYAFTGLAAGTYSVFEAATPGYVEGTNNVGTVNGTPSGTAPAGKDEIDAIQLSAGSAGINYDFGELGASLSGFVYVDADGNGVRDAGDGALGGVALTLKDAGGNTVATTTTAADGSYAFAGLAAGTYSMFEAATPGYAEATNNVGTVNGTASGTAPAAKDEIDAIQLTAGSAGLDYDFGEAGASLAGFAYVDANGDGVRDAGDGALGGVAVTLKDAAGNTVGTATTAADGAYRFAGLAAGTYSVFEGATPGYAEATNNVGTVNGTASGTAPARKDELDGVQLTAGSAGLNYDFGEAGASLAGFAYVDANADGVRDAGDGALGGVAITLKDAGGNTVAATTTAADGSYRFAGLAAGTYTVFEAATPGYAEATNNAGTVNGTPSGTAPAGKDELDSVQLTAGSTGVNYDFGEAGASLAGFAYVDANGNGVRDAGDGALGGVAITLKDSTGNRVATTTTAADGSYSFAGLAAGTYSVLEAATPGYVEGTNDVGTVNGAPSGTAPAGKDEIDSVQLSAGGAGINYDFGEAGASLAGFVYVDANGNGVRDAGDGALAGVAITLKDAAGNTVASTATAADGSYRFAGLAAGTYSVFEAATPGYAEASNSVGTVNGTASGTAPAGKDEIDTIQLTAGSAGLNYDFGEAGHSLSGFVYVDTNGDGVRDPGDAALGGVVLTLKDAGGNTVATTTTTAADGSYLFAGLAAGTYSVSEAATPGYLEGTNNVGTVNGSASGTAPAGKDEIDAIQLPAGGTGVNYDFGEAGASLAGFAYVDANANGVRDPGDGALAGVAITLKDAGGNTVASTTTAADGSYSFAGLAAGTYTVFEAATPGYAEATNNAGTVNGTPSGTAPAGKDELDSVQLTAGSTGVNYDFGEAGASLAGFAYLDNNANGVRDAGDRALAGVAITLKDAGGHAVGTTATAADGSYRFTGLAAGTYSVFEAATPGYLEGKNNVGTVNRAASGTAPAGKDEIDAVHLPAGSAGVNYNFGEQAPAPVVSNPDPAPVAADPAPGSISGIVFYDTNGNGVRDHHERLARGVLVTLHGIDASGQRVVLTQRTGPGGSYFFGNLQASSYTLSVAPPRGYVTNGGASGLTLDPGGSRHPGDIALRRRRMGKIRFLATTVRALLGLGR